MNEDLSDCEKHNKVIEEICNIINKNHLMKEEVFRVYKCFLLGFLNDNGIKTKDEIIKVLELEEWEKIIKRGF